MGADFHGAHGTIEESRDLLVFEMLEAGEHEYFPVNERQVAEGGAEEGDVVSGGGLFGRLRAGVRMFDEVGGIGGRRRGGMFAEIIGGDFAGDVVDPGGKLSFVAVSVPVFENSLKNNLHKVFAGRRLVGQTHEKSMERAVVAFEKFPEPADFPGADGDHEIVIGESFHSRSHVTREWLGGNW